MLQSSLKTVNKNSGDVITATVRLKKKKEARSLLEKMQEEQSQLVAAKVQLEKLAFIDKSKVDVVSSKKTHNVSSTFVFSDNGSSGGQVCLFFWSVVKGARQQLDKGARKKLDSSTRCGQLGSRKLG